MLKWDKIGLGGDGGSKKYKKRRTSFMYVPLDKFHIPVFREVNKNWNNLSLFFDVI